MKLDLPKTRIMRPITKIISIKGNWNNSETAKYVKLPKGVLLGVATIGSVGYEFP